MVDFQDAIFPEFPVMISEIAYTMECIVNVC